MWNLEDQENSNLQTEQQEKEIEEEHQQNDQLKQQQSEDELNHQFSDDLQDIIINRIEDSSQILINDNNIIDYSSSKYINFITNDENKNDLSNELHQQDDDLLELTTSQYIQPSCSNTHDNDSNLTYHSSLNETTQNYGILKVIFFIFKNLFNINFKTKGNSYASPYYSSNGSNIINTNYYFNNNNNQNQQQQQQQQNGDVVLLNQSKNNFSLGLISLLLKSYKIKL